jgi:hypothetical protein
VSYVDDERADANYRGSEDEDADEGDLHSLSRHGGWYAMVQSGNLTEDGFCLPPSTDSLKRAPSCPHLYMPSCCVCARCELACMCNETFVRRACAGPDGLFCFVLHGVSRQDVAARMRRSTQRTATKNGVCARLG